MIALDTNVLIYACDKSDPRRQHAALELIERATDGVLLWQVACEFVAASRKLSAQGFSASDAWSRLTEFLGVNAIDTDSSDQIVEDFWERSQEACLLRPLFVVCCAPVGALVICLYC